MVNKTNQKMEELKYGEKNQPKTEQLKYGEKKLAKHGATKI